MSDGGHAQVPRRRADARPMSDLVLRLREMSHDYDHDVELVQSLTGEAADRIQLLEGVLGNIHDELIRASKGEIEK